jgi:hypothetical protein
MKETRNYGLKGGNLHADPTATQLARALTTQTSTHDNWVLWQPTHARLYVDIGCDQAEHYANWGI